MDERVNKARSITRFGEKLHTLRTQQNLTLQSLARLIGHTASWIS
jgi:transcriptional regulator with XRE-family HTH domain